MIDDFNTNGYIRDIPFETIYLRLIHHSDDINPGNPRIRSSESVNPCVLITLMHRSDQTQWYKSGKTVNRLIRESESMRMTH
mgnify:CR=1 FL=1